MILIRAELFLVSRLVRIPIMVEKFAAMKRPTCRRETIIGAPLTVVTPKTAISLYFGMPIPRDVQHDAGGYLSVIGWLQIPTLGRGLCGMSRRHEGPAEKHML